MRVRVSENSVAKQLGKRQQGARKGWPRERKLVRTFTATAQELTMLEALARYHGFSKSATITNLLKKEFWRVFPKGTVQVQTDPGARIFGEEAP